jgi:hypothetical protein
MRIRLGSGQSRCMTALRGFSTIIDSELNDDLDGETRGRV